MVGKAKRGQFLKLNNTGFIILLSSNSPSPTQCHPKSMCIHQLASHRPVLSLILEDQTPVAWVTLHNDKSNEDWKSKMFRKSLLKWRELERTPAPTPLGLTMSGSSGKGMW